MSIETRIAELEKKFGLHEPPPVRHRLMFVDPRDGVVSVTWLEGRGDPRDSVPGKHFFEREPNESEKDFLAHINEIQPKETP